jgi:hypothetical protein
LTAEEIVPKLDHADIITQFIDAVIPAPRGALPTSCHPLYQIDGEAMLDYVEQVSDPNSFATYLPNIINF